MLKQAAGEGKSCAAQTGRVGSRARGRGAARPHVGRDFPVRCFTQKLNQCAWASYVKPPCFAGPASLKRHLLIVGRETASAELRTGFPLEAEQSHGLRGPCAIWGSWAPASSVVALISCRTKLRKQEPLPFIKPRVQPGQPRHTPFPWAAWY